MERFYVILHDSKVNEWEIYSEHKNRNTFWFNRDLKNSLDYNLEEATKVMDSAFKRFYPRSHFFENPPRILMVKKEEITKYVN